MAIRIGVRELKNRLSAVLRRVARGETVTVTSRERPIALLVSLAAGDQDETLRALAKTGRISWGSGKPHGNRKPPRLRGAPATRAVLEDRR